MSPRAHSTGWSQDDEDAFTRQKTGSYSHQTVSSSTLSPIDAAPLPQPNVVEYDLSGVVVQSESPSFKAGDEVFGMCVRTLIAIHDHPY